MKKRTIRPAPFHLKCLFALALILNVCFWWDNHKVKLKWPGVPPVPSATGATAMTLGDDQFSYRLFALTLQNLGDTGGDVTPLREYEFDKLKHWFNLTYKLDPVSNHVPMIAAYYFGGVDDPDQIRVIVDYLHMAGSLNIGEKWRWLAHAVFLARHKMHDLELAQKMAYELADAASKSDSHVPAWAMQMPAFVLKEQGEKEAALDIMMTLLKSEAENMHPNEVNFMLAYIEEQLGYNLEDLGIHQKVRR